MTLSKTAGGIAAIITIVIVVGGYLLFSRATPTQRLADQPTFRARIASTTGTVTITHADGVIADAHIDMELHEGDEIWTRESAEASIELFSGSRTALWHDTRVKINTAKISSENWKQQRVQLHLVSGRIWSRVLRLLDLESSYEITTNNVIASVRGTAFQTRANGPIVDVDQFDGELYISGVATGTLRAGYTATLNTTRTDVLIDEVQYFTSDQTRNDRWIREQLRADAEFAQRAGAARSSADGGITDDLSPIGLEAGPFTLAGPGAEHTFEGVKITQDAATQELRAIAMLRHTDGRFEERDVTREAVWLTSEPDVSGTVTVIARWNDGTHEHSGEYRLAQ